MPATHEEFIAAAEALINPGLTTSLLLPEAWQDGTPVTDDDRENIRALARFARRYEEDRKVRRSEAQRRARTLLRSLLSPDQRRQLSRTGEFTATAPSGATYRFSPKRGHVELVTRHGSRWFVRTRYCIHDDRDDGDAMPPADLTVTHLLMVLADEDEFLATANHNDRRDQLWNSEYLRRMQRRHQA